MSTPPGTSQRRTETAPAPKPSRHWLPEWLWLGRELERAEALLRAQPEADQRALARARAAAELAQRTLEPVEPLEAGPAKWLALVLYRAALESALVAQSGASAGSTLTEVWDSTPEDLRAFAAGGGDAVARLRAVALDKPASLSAADPPDVQDAEARLVKAAVERLIRRREEPEHRRSRVLLMRWLRIGALLVVLLAILVALLHYTTEVAKGPDLALEKPWRTSSVRERCKPAARRCAGARTRIVFHTEVEQDPWFELDLRRAVTLSLVEVENREDCCPDRAIPLIVEVSTDRETWTEVMRRSETFYEWQARFAPRKARYVRLRVPRETVLHLTRVSVYAG